MEKPRWIAFFFVPALIFFFTCPGSAFEIGARGLYWLPSFKADIKVDSAGLTGSTLNLKDTLGVKDASFPSVEIFAGNGRHRLTAAYTPIAYSGATTLSQTIAFDGRTFALNNRVETELTLRMFDLEYRYTFLDFENLAAGFSFALIAQVKYIDGDAKINAPADGIGAAYAFRAPMPMLGLGAHVGLISNLLEARVKATGIAYSDSHLYEASGDLSFTPFPFLDIHAGYKMIRLKIDRSELFLQSEFSGPYIGLTVSF